jgi:hypothetical protein
LRFLPSEGYAGERKGLGAVAPLHYVFAAFVPKFTFSGKQVIDYNVTAFDPIRHLKAGARPGGH